MTEESGRCREVGVMGKEECKMIPIYFSGVQHSISKILILEYVSQNAQIKQKLIRETDQRRVVRIKFVKKKWDFVYIFRQSLNNCPLSRGYLDGASFSCLFRC